MAVFSYTLAELEDQLQEALAEEQRIKREDFDMSSPDYEPGFSYEGEDEKKDLIGQFRSHLQDELNGCLNNIAITKERIEKAKRSKRKKWSG